MSFIDFAGSKISHLLDFSLKAGKPIFRDELRSRLWKFVIRSIIKTGVDFCYSSSGDFFTIWGVVE